MKVLQHESALNEMREKINQVEAVALQKESELAAVKYEVLVNYSYKFIVLGPVGGLFVAVHVGWLESK